MDEKEVEKLSRKVDKLSLQENSIFKPEVSKTVPKAEEEEYIYSYFN